MNLVCILLAIAPLSFASIDIIPFDVLTRIIQFFSEISKSYDSRCSDIAKDLLTASNTKRQSTPSLLFKLNKPEQKEDPVKVLKWFKDGITYGFEIENKVGCAWDPDKIICVFGNNSCGS